MSRRTRNAHRNLDVLFGGRPFVLWATLWCFILLVRVVPAWCAP